MVAFGILLQNVGKWQGPTNAIFHSLTDSDADSVVRTFRNGVDSQTLSAVIVDPVSLRFRFRYFSQIQIWTLAIVKSWVSTIKY